MSTCGCLQTHLSCRSSHVFDTKLCSGALDAWPALHLWTPAYLQERAGDALVTVDVTPNGRADSATVVGEWVDLFSSTGLQTVQTDAPPLGGCSRSTFKEDEAKHSSSEVDSLVPDVWQTCRDSILLVVTRDEMMSFCVLSSVVKINTTGRLIGTAAT